MQMTFGLETMGAMEAWVLREHDTFGIRHPRPDKEAGKDAYWSHVLVDWLALHEGFEGPEADTPEEAVLLEKANAFLHRYWDLLANEWGDFLTGVIWAIEPRVSPVEEE